MLGFTAKIFIALPLMVCFFLGSSKAQWLPTFSVSSLEIHALCSERNTVIAGGSHRKVLYSSDQGHTWSNLSLDLPTGHENIETLLADGNYLWIAIPGLGIRRSADGGVSWDWANEGLESFHIHALIEQDGKLLAGTNAGVFVSTDKANRWQPLPLESTSTEVRALYIQGDQLYAGTAKGELYYSGNQGGDWEILTRELLRKPIQSILIKDQMIHLATQGQGVYHSLDGGKSWLTIKKGMGSAYVHDLALGDNRIWAATDAGLYFLTEGADQWEKLNGMHGGEINATFALNVQHNHIYAGTSRQGVMRSPDSGLHWEKIPKGAMQQSIQVLFDGGEALYAGISNNIYASVKGEYWQKAPDLPGKVKDFATSGKYLFTATEAGIYRKLPGEVPWALVSSPIPVNCIISWREEVFAGTAREGILKSTDGGDIWEPAGLPGENILTLVTDGKQLIAGTQEGVFLSDDQGMHWQKVMADEDIIALKAYKSKLLCGAKTGLFHSSDGGKSWEKIFYDAYNYSIKNIITTPTNIIILDNAGRFFVSYDEGTTWQPYNLPVLGNITALAVYREQIIAGTTDKGIWQHALLPSREGEQVIEALSLYPNPASEKIFLNLPTSEHPHALSLYDVHGRYWQHKILHFPENELDISLMPRGVYYLKVSGKEEEKVFRVVIGH